MAYSPDYPWSGIGSKGSLANRISKGGSPSKMTGKGAVLASSCLTPSTTCEKVSSSIGSSSVESLALVY